MCNFNEMVEDSVVKALSGNGEVSMEKIKEVVDLIIDAIEKARETVLSFSDEMVEEISSKVRFRVENNLV